MGNENVFLLEKIMRIELSKATGHSARRVSNWTYKDPRYNIWEGTQIIASNVSLSYLLDMLGIDGGGYEGQ